MAIPSGSGTEVLKNNLQMIISLFSLQGESIDDPERIANLKDIQQRVQSMALIHEKIYNSESIGKINFQKYVKDLIKEIFQDIHRKFMKLF